MAKPIYGKDRILLFRELGSEGAVKLGLQIEHTTSLSRNQEFKQTKDGALTISSGLEATLSFTAVSSNDPVNLMLRNSVIEGKKVEVWDIDLTEEEDGKYPAMYAQGSLDSWELPANVEGTADITSSMKIDFKPRFGLVTLPEGVLNELSQGYDFVDLNTAVTE